MGGFLIHHAFRHDVSEEIGIGNILSRKLAQLTLFNKAYVIAYARMSDVIALWKVAYFLKYVHDTKAPSS